MAARPFRLVAAPPRAAPKRSNGGEGASLAGGGRYNPAVTGLDEVVAAAAQGPSRQQFSLTFRGGPEPPVPHGLYRLEHVKLGALELFLVPIAPATYEAVFT